MRSTLLTAAAVSALIVASAMAQNAAPNAPAAGTTDKMTSPATDGAAMGANPTAPAPAPADAGKAAAQATPVDRPTFVSVKNSDMLSSNVVGLDVYNGQNDAVGKIQDVAFDSSKQMTGYIVSVGGFLGMGTRYVAVDPNAVMVQFDASKNAWRATMNATKDELKAAPEFKYGGQWTARGT